MHVAGALNYWPSANVLQQHSCVYVKRSGQFQANQAQEQLDEIAKHNTPVCHLCTIASWCSECAY